MIGDPSGQEPAGCGRGAPALGLDALDPLAARLARARGVLEALARAAPELAGAGAHLTDVLLAVRDAASSAPAASALTPDGAPLALCWSSTAAGRAVRLLSDPAIDRAVASDRYAAALEALAAARRLRADDSLEPLLAGLLEQLGPTAERPLARFGLGVLHVDAALDHRACGAHVACVDAHEPAWHAVLAWLHELLPDPAPARVTIAGLGEHVVPLSASVRGAGARDARCRLRVLPHATGWLRAGRVLGLLADPALRRALAGVLRGRPVRPSALRLEIGFDVATGALVEASVEIGARSAGYRRQHWPELVARAADAAGVPAPPTAALLAAGADLMMLALGCDAAGRRRLDLHLRGRV